MSIRWLGIGRWEFAQPHAVFRESDHTMVEGPSHSPGILSMLSQKYDSSTYPTEVYTAMVCPVHGELPAHHCGRFHGEPKFPDLILKARLRDKTWCELMQEDQ